MKAQTLRNDQMMGHMNSQKTLELNTDNAVIKELHNKLSVDKNDKTIKDIVWLLFETTLINSGFQLEEPSMFCDRINRMIRMGLSVDDDEDDEQENVIEEINTDVNDDVDENNMEDVD